MSEGLIVSRSFSFLVDLGLYGSDRHVYVSTCLSLDVLCLCMSGTYVYAFFMSVRVCLLGLYVGVSMCLALTLKVIVN